MALEEVARGRGAGGGAFPKPACEGRGPWEGGWTSQVPGRAPAIHTVTIKRAVRLPKPVSCPYPAPFPPCSLAPHFRLHCFFLRYLLAVTGFPFFLAVKLQA